MKKKISIDEIKDRLFKVHGDMVTLDENSYMSLRFKARFIDKDFGEFWNTPKNVIRGKQGHPQKSRQKLEETNLRKYGVRRPLQNKDIRNKYKKTCEEIYGADNPLKNKAVQEKMKANNLEKYGVEFIVLMDGFREKSRESCMEKFGCPVSSQAEEVKEKTRLTNVEKFGCSCPMTNPDIHEKIIAGFIEKYGEDNPMKNAEVQERMKQVILDKYGVEYTFQSEEIKAKGRETSILHYGVTHPQKDPEIAIQSARSRNNSTIKTHWKTGKEIVCMASYEAAVVDYFNSSKINFVWLESAFEMPDGRHYLPDCYLTDEDKWLEIKGHFWGDAEEKWNWFHDKYKNSELWNTEKLKSLGIL